MTERAAANTAFRPHWALRHPQLQSILASKSPRRKHWLKRGSRMEAVARFHELDAGNGVRLCGYHSSQERPRGLAVLIHGWEGSHESSYLYSMACTLFAAGYNVFRLNLRDHGGSHHLNREMFHSARIDEVIGAIKAVRAFDTTDPLTLIGFSLGGSFSLRVGLHGPAQGLQPALAIGISPAINPRSTVVAIDTGPHIFRWYFTEKWRETVRAKLAAWPDLNTQPLLQDKTLLGITTRFAETHTEYGALDPYFAVYTLSAEQLHESPTPLAILTAADDPVIPIADFLELRVRGSLKALDITPYGGHCGFIENFGLQSWAERRVLELLSSDSNA